MDTGEGQEPPYKAVSRDQTEHIAGDKTSSKARPALFPLGADPVQQTPLSPFMGSPGQLGERGSTRGRGPPSSGCGPQLPW